MTTMEIVTIYVLQIQLLMEKSRATNVLVPRTIHSIQTIDLAQVYQNVLYNRESPKCNYL